MGTLVSMDKSCFIPFQNIEEIFAMMEGSFPAEKLDRHMYETE